MRIFFFGDDYTDDFEDPTAKPLKDWDDKHLPFVGWTFTRFEMKDKPSTISIFQPGDVNSSPLTMSVGSLIESEEKKAKKEKSKMNVWGKKEKEKAEKDTKSKDKKK